MFLLAKKQWLYANRDERPPIWRFNWRGLGLSILIAGLGPTLLAEESPPKETAYSNKEPKLREGIYVGLILELRGGCAQLIQPTGEAPVELTPTNARGRLLFSSTEIRCLPGAELKIQLRWAGGVTNIASTNWIKIAPSSFDKGKRGGTNSTPGNYRNMLSPAGAQAYEKPKKSPFAFGGYTVGALIGSPSSFRSVEQSRSEAIISLRKEVPDYPNAVLVLGQADRYLKSVSDEHCDSLQEIIDRAKDEIQLMHRTTAINLLEDARILSDQTGTR